MKWRQAHTSQEFPGAGQHTMGRTLQAKLVHVGCVRGFVPDGAPKTGTISESVSLMAGEKNLSTYLNIHKQDSEVISWVIACKVPTLSLKGGGIGKGDRGRLRRGRGTRACSLHGHLPSERAFLGNQCLICYVHSRSFWSPGLIIEPAARSNLGFKCSVHLDVGACFPAGMIRVSSLRFFQ